MQTTMTHVDDFIDDFGNTANGVGYARYFFAMRRFPAALQIDFQEVIGTLKLFCTFEGKRYRVTGCSRLGDIWLTTNFEQEVGYEKRVDVAKCSEWSKTPEKDA